MHCEGCLLADRSPAPVSYPVPANQDIIISVYNIHHSPEVWERAEEFLPERFRCAPPVHASQPALTHRVPQPGRAGAQRGQHRLPVHPLLGGASQVCGRPVCAAGGCHRCAPNPFSRACRRPLLTLAPPPRAALGILLHRFDFALLPGQNIGITTGATIHTTNGLYMTLKPRAPTLVPV